MSFHALGTPLDGLNLIEASAGTGKTWTIAALYARLILEQNLKPEQVLVVTYTKAATAELRGRIRARLAELAEALAQADQPDYLAQLATKDPEFLFPLIEGRTDPAADAIRLRAAVSGFDTAAVYTIHGFCQRALGEHALTAGLELGRSFVADEAELLQAVADAAWQDLTHRASPDWLAYLIAKKQTPDAWVKQLRGWLTMPDLQVDMPPQQDLGDLQQQFTALHQHTAERWLGGEGEAARHWLSDLAAAKLLVGKTHQTRYVEGALAYWHAWLSGAPRATVEIDKKTDAPAGKVWRLHASALMEANKHSSAVPDVFAPFETLTQLALQIQTAQTAALAALHGHLIRELAKRLHARKAKLGVMSFHDLLVELDAALAGNHGSQLAKALLTRYQAALIDEFQDTDPLQFRIFDRLFGDGSVPAFLVGDPKQAIYAFRGAELHAYLAARQRVPTERRFSLGTNRRSTPQLVQAVEAIFTCAPQPFMLPELAFARVHALPDKAELLIDGLPQAALNWHSLSDAPLGKGEADQAAASACAKQIAQLLALGTQQRATLAGQGISGSDIAVLASSHAELAAVQTALSELGVASVRIGRESVLASDEAQDLLQVLNALIDVSDRTVRAALATRLVGLDAAELYALLHDETRWDACLAGFRTWHQLLQQRGPMAALTSWLHDSGTAQRLAQWQDGERQLTNVLHLFELIELAHHERPGLGPLLSWYREALTSTSSGGEEDGRLMRLESDAARVRLVTIHASKGLEYPVVFCPFLWNGQLFKQGEAFPLCHEGDQAVLDLGSPRQTERWALASEERLAEKLRLLYVALTRPRSACFINWAAVKTVEQSALGWLLAGGKIVPREWAALHAEVDALCRAYPATISWLQNWPLVSRNDIAASPVAPTVATLPRRLSWQWQMSSFSGLTAGVHREVPDYDGQPASELVVLDAASTTGRFESFPAGAAAGLCLHGILEDWEFTRRDRPALESLALRHIQAQGLQDKSGTAERDIAPLVQLAADMVEAALATPVTEAGHPLTELTARQKLVELEFLFQLQPFGWQQLADLLATPAFDLPTAFVAAASSLNAEIAAGYLKGFIDLTFELNGRHYILDWKSNKLGDYREASLIDAMAHHHYYLQALIYCVALHRYLHRRKPAYDYEQDFGGALYLFLRGAPDSGLWRYRPPLALIQGLEQLLCGDTV